MISENLKQAHQIVGDILDLNDSRRELDTNITISATNQVIETNQEKIVLPLFIIQNGTKV
jgi:single-stranded-DNA-specific exonuclease